MNIRTWLAPGRWKGQAGDPTDVVIEYMEVTGFTAYCASAIKKAIELRSEGWTVLDHDGLWFRHSRFAPEGEPKNRHDSITLRRFTLSRLAPVGS